MLLSICLTFPVDQKNQIEKVEEQELLEKEKEEKRLKEAEKNESEQIKQLAETSHTETKETVGELPFSVNQVGCWSCCHTFNDYYEFSEQYILCYYKFNVMKSFQDSISADTHRFFL